MYSEETDNSCDILLGMITFHFIPRETLIFCVKQILKRSCGSKEITHYMLDLVLLSLLSLKVCYISTCMYLLYCTTAKILLNFLRNFIFILDNVLNIIWDASWQNQQNDCAPSEDSDQPGHPPSLIRIFAVRMKKAWVLATHWVQAKTLIRLGGCPGWSKSSLGAQSLCWFSHEVAHLQSTTLIQCIGRNLHTPSRTEKNC